MSDETGIGITQIIATLIALIFVSAMLPAIIPQLSSVNSTIPAPQIFSFPEFKFDDPLQRGIARNIGTGILVIILIGIASGIVLALRFLMSAIRGEGETA